MHMHYKRFAAFVYFFLSAPSITYPCPSELSPRHERNTAL